MIEQCANAITYYGITMRCSRELGHEGLCCGAYEWNPDTWITDVDWKD